MPLSKSDWTMAISQLVVEGHFGPIILWHNGNQADTYGDLEVLDDDTNTDVKPDEAVLDAAHSRWQTLEAARQEMATAKAIGLEQARDYIRTQLANQAPDVAVIFGTIKPHVDSNLALNRMVTNQIALMRACFAWPALDLSTPLGRQRYILAVIQVIALLA